MGWMGRDLESSGTGKSPGAELQDAVKSLWVKIFEGISQSRADLVEAVLNTKVNPNKP